MRMTPPIGSGMRHMSMSPRLQKMTRSSRETSRIPSTEAASR